MLKIGLSIVFRMTLDAAVLQKGTHHDIPIDHLRHKIAHS
jgi:hypothetical protein